MSMYLRVAVTVFILAPFAILQLTESVLFTINAKLSYPHWASGHDHSSEYDPVAAGNGSRQLMEDDEELMRRAVLSVASSGDDNVNGSTGSAGKVAFMFLTKGRMPLMPLWERFFQGQDNRGLFSIYRHVSLPEYEERLPESSVFFGSRVPGKMVQWGRPSMIDAERRLLANALLDRSNQWFVLLSESCIPLFNFTHIYAHLSGSHLSFLSSYDDPNRTGRGRYNPSMDPIITLHDWRKGSQWFALQRALAVDIVTDKTYYPLFRDYCKSPCYSDEHYLPTVVNVKLLRLNSNRSVTWVSWGKAGSPHPVTYRKRDVSVRLIERMRRGKGCVYNGSASDVCYLFARKFHANTLGALLRLAKSLKLY